MFESIDKSAPGEQREAFVSTIGPPANVFRLGCYRVSEFVVDWFICPLALREEKSVVARGERDNVDFVFAIPPRPNLRVWAEYFLPDRFPGDS